MTNTGAELIVRCIGRVQVTRSRSVAGSRATAQANAGLPFPQPFRFRSRARCARASAERAGNNLGNAMNSNILASNASGINGARSASNGGAFAVAVPAPAARDATDVQMDQIRDLLFGEFKTVIEGRLAAMDARLTALEAGLTAARAEEEHRRRAAFDNLAEGLTTLAQSMRQLRP